MTRRTPHAMLAVVVATACASPLGAGEPSHDEPFAIEVVDRATGRGVPLVELETVHHLRCYTDSRGLVAFHEPGLMHTKVFFHVRSHGYEFPADGFGIRGKALDVVPGGHARLEIDRVNIAERLYRVTGGGIYADAVLLGRPTPLRRPLVNALVFGSDSVQCAPFRGRLYWFWGDTNRAAYPLGNFKTTGATSQLPHSGGLEPDVGVDLEYFADDGGFARAMVPLESRGPIWITGLVVLGDTEAGDERMFAHYEKIKPGAGFDVEERGLVEFDAAANRFRHAATFPPTGPFPDGAHALVHREPDADGRNYVYFCNPFPLVRVAADPESLKHLERYEAYTCLKTGTTMNDGQFDRDADGKLRWAWRADTESVGPLDVDKLAKAGKLRREESPFPLRDAVSGKPVLAHRGTIAWNAYRKRWIMLFCEQFGSSVLGETWFAEAPDLHGPWTRAVKIVTHDRYSFYNPKHHPYFDADGGRIVYFEGTYTHAFSGNPVPTPRYDYNQIMYRLDLADPRLRPAAD